MIRAVVWDLARAAEMGLMALVGAWLAGIGISPGGVFLIVTGAWFAAGLLMAVVVILAMRGLLRSRRR